MNILTEDELRTLRRSITDLLNFIRCVQWEEDPYFYRPLENMKNNIEIYLYTRNGERELLYEVLFRDWRKANNYFVGIPSCELRTEMENAWNLNCRYRELLMGVGKYFPEKWQGDF